MAVSGVHLISNRLNVAQVLAAAQTELLELLGDPSTKKVREESARPREEAISLVT